MNEAATRLCLGTAQFGLDYGIVNTRGRILRDEVAAILAEAHKAGIRHIDTATAYGNSEETLGAIGVDRRFSVITKIPAIPADQAVEQFVNRTLVDSLSRLRIERIDAVMAHDANDLLGAAGAGFWQALVNARERGICRKIGASVYDARQIDALMDRFPIEIIQLPLSPIDDRLIRSGHLERLAARGVEVHIRSLFLQGLLLVPMDQLIPKFAAIGRALVPWREAWRAGGMTDLEGILAWAFAEQRVSRAVFGVTGIDELRQILLAARKAAVAKDAPIRLEQPPLDARLLNPAHWHELE